MAIGINNNGSSMMHYIQRQNKTANEKKAEKNAQALPETQSDYLEDDSPAAKLTKFADSVDEMAAALAQFRNRRDLEKKSGAAGETAFDRVLDEELEPKLGKLIEILDKPQDANIEHFLRQARSLFPDESDLVLVLREMLRRKNLEKTIRNRLKLLLAKVEKEENPKRVKAGINVALKARLFGKKLKMNPALMRESYRNFLESEDHEVELYQQWISTYGMQHRAAVIHFMEDALLADIGAVDPSCSQSEFGNLLARIGQIKLIRSGEAAFTGGVLQNEFVCKANSNEQAWLLFFFSVLQSPDELKYFIDMTIGEYLHMQSSGDKARLLQILSYFLKKLPDRLFYQPEDREALFDAFKLLNEKILQQERTEKTNR